MNPLVCYHRNVVSIKCSCIVFFFPDFFFFFFQIYTEFHNPGLITTDTRSGSHLVYVGSLTRVALEVRIA